MELNSAQSTRAGEIAGRRRLMAALAQATTDEIAGALATIDAPAHKELRPAESGLVMIRARVGGDGAPFNLGEATVTRAAVQLKSGEIGFSYVLGRDREKARLAAIADALWQCADAPPRSSRTSWRRSASGSRASARRRARRPPRRASISSPWCAERVTDDRSPTA